MSTIERTLFAGLILIVLWLPIPLGSDIPWARSLFELASIGLLLMALALRPVRASAGPALAGYRLPLALLVLWIGYQLLQLVPLPVDWVAALRPLRGHEAGASLTPLTINPSSSIDGILFNIGCIALMLLAVFTINSRQRLKAMLITLTVIGTLHAIYALLVYATDGALSFFKMPKAFNGPHVFGQATRGTFVSYNHFVDLMAICLGFAVAYFFDTASRSGNKQPKKGPVLALLDTLLSGHSLLLAAMAIMLAALLMSTSRGGFLAFAFTFSLVPLAVQLRRRKTAPRSSQPPDNDAKSARRAWLLLIPMLLALSVGTEGGLLQRFEKHQFHLSGRDKIFASTLELIRDQPLTGAGTNTFFEAHHPYKHKDLRGADTPYVWPHAHNGYLELMAEQGMIGFVLLGSAIALLWVKFFRLASYRNMPTARYGLLGVLLGMSMMLVHATAEYDFQIPALAAYFYLMLGIGMAAGGMRGKG